MSFGYASDSLKRDIQAGIWNELGLPVGLPLSCYKCSIREWVKLAANIPLLYQPGEDWSYGPQLSILGSLIEIIDGRKVDQYMKDEIWDPLQMNDTGFFIQDSDPNYTDKVNRVAKLYVNIPKIVTKFIGTEIPFPPIYEAQTCLYAGNRNLSLIDSGMYTTIKDFMKFMKMYLNRGRSDTGVQIISEDIINILSTYHVCYDVSNLSTVDGYSSGLAISPSKSPSVIRRKRLLTEMQWGLKVGTIKGCKNLHSDNHEIRAITWAGVLGTRFLIDFCSGVAYNAGTNVIGPPAGTIDSDLIELNYKPLDKEGYSRVVRELFI
jgi:CubicO group peptidase (beta-lactamase class C family)